MPFPGHKDPQLTIFDALPAATEDTFYKGVLSTNTQEESLSVILYSPNLQIIASLDNTTSEVTSSYSTSVSHGFTFGSTQSFSITEEAGVNIEIVSAKTSVTFALSITEQWNETTTRSMDFSCPPGKKAFVYQGTLMSRILKFDAATAQYSWVGNPAKALTQVLVTTETPIGNAPSNPVTLAS